MVVDHHYLMLPSAHSRSEGTVVSMAVPAVSGPRSSPYLSSGSAVQTEKLLPDLNGLKRHGSAFVFNPRRQNQNYRAAAETRPLSIPVKRSAWLEDFETAHNERQTGGVHPQHRPPLRVGVRGCNDDRQLLGLQLEEIVGLVLRVQAFCIDPRSSCRVCQ